MIIILLREINEDSIAYVREWGPAPRSRMRLMRYDDLLQTQCLDPATYIFSDLDVLSDAQFTVAREAWRTLSGSARGLRLINNPAAAVTRFELLSALHAEGINRFRAVRAGDIPHGLNFPVFVRYEKRHTGPLTPLLHDMGELRRALRYLRVRGHPLRDLLVVEFCDTADARGITRKYAAFLVGDRVLPRHLFFSRDWMIKGGGPMDRAPMEAALEAEKLDYLYGNPHEQWIRRIFRRAGLEFGRIDYGMLGGLPQVWEINSIPTMKDMTPRLTKAFEAIDHRGGAGEPVAFSASRSLACARRRELRRQRRDDGFLAVMDRLAAAPLTRPAARLARLLLRYQ